jgi:maltose alpha-D-glucosyltransferase / alpha-amylase
MLGRRTAELHLALASGSGAAFEPEDMDARALNLRADGMRAHARAALDRLVASRERLPDADRSLADEVLAAREALDARLDEIRRLEGAGRRIRVHGDYHLGQIVRVEEDFFIRDYAVGAEERRAKVSPLVDVASMVRSFNFAAYAALFAVTPHAPDDFVRMAPWADAWQYWVCDAFVREYRSAMDGTMLLPSGDGFDALLRALTLEKALSQLAYELNNRPEWVRIPLIGLLKLTR